MVFTIFSYVDFSSFFDPCCFVTVVSVMVFLSSLSSFCLFVVLFFPFEQRGFYCILVGVFVVGLAAMVCFCVFSFVFFFSLLFFCRVFCT